MKNPFRSFRTAALLGIAAIAAAVTFTAVRADDHGLTVGVQQASAQSSSAVNYDFTVLDDADLTGGGTLVSSTFTNYYHSGVLLYLTATETGTATLACKAQGCNSQGLTSACTDFYDLPDCAFSTISATGTDTFEVFPGITDESGETCASHLPRKWRVSCTITAGASSGFDVVIGGSLLL